MSSTTSTTPVRETKRLRRASGWHRAVSPIALLALWQLASSTGLLPQDKLEGAAVAGTDIECSPGSPRRDVRHQRPGRAPGPGGAAVRHQGARPLRRHRWTDDRAPRLDEAHAWVLADVASTMPAGDHVLVLGDVLAAEATGGRPLAYWQRTFGTHQAF